MESTEFTFPPNVLRKLARLHARVEGAQAVAQATQQAVTHHQAALQAALTEACDDEGLTLPENGNTPINIDWRTGRLHLGDPHDIPAPDRR